jgi:hypothetical protein
LIVSDQSKSELSVPSVAPFDARPGRAAAEPLAQGRLAK